jgi:hypothetical protein
MRVSSSHSIAGRYAVLIPTALAVGATLVSGRLLRMSVTVSCIAIVALLAAERFKTSKWIIFISLVISMLADSLLQYSENNPVRLVFGIMMFLPVHLGYMLFCLRYGRVNRFLFSILVTGYGLFLILKLMPGISIPVLKLSVALYALASCLSLAASAGLWLSFLPKFLFVAGIAAMVFSDTLIACREFIHVDLLHGNLIMPAYYASQILVTASLTVDERWKIIISQPLDDNEI